MLNSWLILSKLTVMRLVLIESAVNVCCSCLISLTKSVLRSKKRVDVNQAYKLKISRNPAFGSNRCRNTLIVKSGKILAILDTCILNRWVCGVLIKLFASSNGARASALSGNESKPCSVAKYPNPKQTIIAHNISASFCPFLCLCSRLLPFTPSRLMMMCLSF